MTLETEKTAIHIETNGAVATANSPLVKAAGTDLAVYDYGNDAGAGFENVTRDEYAIPFIYVLDAKSPQCAPPNAGGIPGAKAGMLFNTATGALYDGEKGTPFVPCHRETDFGEWIKRNEDGSGGGFVGIRSPNDPLVLELRTRYGQFGKLLTDDGHELVETHKIYGLLLDETGMAGPGVVPFKSTGIAAYKNFMTRIMSIQYQGEKTEANPTGMVRPPFWAHLWRLGTQYRPAKKAGQSGWYIPKLWLNSEPALSARLKRTDPLYAQGKELFEAIRAGRVTVKNEEQQKPDSEIPF